MQITNFPFAKTHLFSKLILDYIKQDENVSEFYHYAPDIDVIGQIIEDKKKESINRKLLVQTILKQYIDLENIHQNVSVNIELFGNENTFCIVTAHQLNVFTGPLYYIYKIAQTISSCRQLKIKYPENNFIPVYWLGSEDHDFEEINHISLYHKKIEWTDKQGGAIGEYSVQSILPLIEEIKTILNVSDEHEIITLFKNAYSKNTLTQATRYMVNELFAEYGLVVIDGNDAVFKKQFSSIMKDELMNHHSEKLVAEQLRKLDSKGYKQQAFPREINLFYLSKNSRDRIEYNSDLSKYIVLNTKYTFTQEEILFELETHPERFSPNVILRPLYQQKILPGLAYLGGAGELSYWLQLKSLFEYYNINYPQLILRNSVLFVNENSSKKIDKIGFKISDFFNENDVLKINFIKKITDEDIDLSLYKIELENTFSKLQEKTRNIDASMVNAVGAELQKTLQSIDSIQKRLLKSLKQKNETELLQIDKIKAQLFPENKLQERVENFASYYVKSGQAFIDMLIVEFDVYKNQFLIIVH